MPLLSDALISLKAKLFNIANFSLLIKKSALHKSALSLYAVAT